MADLKESGSGSNLAEDEDADEQKGLAPSRPSVSLSRVPTSSLLGGATSPMSPRSSSHITGQYRAVRVVAVPDAIEQYQHEAYAEARHRVVQSDFVSTKQTVVEWRMKERMRTISAALVMCLNIGVDPPDVVKPQPCARLECWLDPLAMPPQKALDTIGNALQQQYERWLPPQKARYKLSLDPTLEEIRKLGSAMRKGSKEERVLFHYNGHGVPRPTPNGEIWVFNKTFTQYIPLSIFDLQQWLGTPSIYVFDCSAAGQVLESFIQYEAQFRDPVTKTLENCRESLLLLPCGPNELLPMNPEFPADLFTSCLTAPIKTALRWFASRSTLTRVTADLIDRIPGKIADRKTPLGELNWIFTAITDTIAWNLLPRDLFQKLFRQDLLVASLFRNFLLAERILRSVNCTPISKPRLPPAHLHPMWRAWDLAAEFSLSQLEKYVKAGATPAAEAAYESSQFFAEQLTAFEVWLQFGSEAKPPPMQLPVVLQVLLSVAHRYRALVLLAKFLDKGPWAVNQALSVGIFPYVLKLLQSPAVELRDVLVFIWAKILALDQSCHADLIRDEKEEYQQYFISHLMAAPSDGAVSMPAPQRCMAAFVLLQLCNNRNRNGQRLVLQGGALQAIKAHMLAEDPLVRRWMCFLIAKLCEKYDEAAMVAIRDGITEKLRTLLRDSVPEVRASALFAIASFLGAWSRAAVAPLLPTSVLGPAPSSGGAVLSFLTSGSVAGSVQPKQAPASSTYSSGELLAERERDARRSVQMQLTRSAMRLAADASVLVRRELVISLSQLVSAHRDEFVKLAAEKADEEAAVGVIAPANSAHTGHQRSASANQLSAMSMTSPLLGPSSLAAPSLPPIGEAVDIDGKDDSGRDERDVRDSSVRVKVWRVLQWMCRDPCPAVAHTAQHVIALVTSAIPAYRAAVAASVVQDAANAAALNAQSSSTQQQRGSLVGGRVPIPEATQSGLRKVQSMDSKLGNAPTALPTQLFNRHKVTAEMRQLGADPALLSRPLAPGANSGSSLTPSSSAPAVPTRENSGSNIIDDMAWVLPASPFFEWSVEYFSQPLMGVVSSTDVEAAAILGAASQSTMSSNSLASLNASSVISSAAMRAAAAAVHAAATNASLPPTVPSQAAAAVHSLAARVAAETRANKSWRLQRNLALRQQATELPKRFSVAPITHAGSSLKPPPSPSPTTSTVVSDTSSSSNSHRFEEQIAIFQTEFTETSFIQFHAYEPLLFAADGRDHIGLWNYEEGEKLNVFSNQNARGTRISSLHLMNDMHVSLLLTAADDGVVRIWRNAHLNKGQELVSAFSAFPRLPRGAAPSPGLVLDWQQYTGHILAGGSIDMIRVWDVEREQCVVEMPLSPVLQQSLPVGSQPTPPQVGILSGMSGSLTAPSPSLLPNSIGAAPSSFVLGGTGATYSLNTNSISSTLDGGLFAAGCNDGSVRVFDIRQPQPLVAKLMEHRAQVVKVHFQSGPTSGGLLVSGGVSGDVVLTDLRYLSSDSVVKIAAHSNSDLNALSVHNHAPLIASGSHKQFIKVFNTNGEPLSMIRYHDGFIGQRIGPISSLAFHPHKLLLAAGALDSYISIYAGS